MNRSQDFPNSLALFERAARVIPCGIYGHMTPAATVPGAFPYFAHKAAGCRYSDVDGRSYIDFLCGYGPIILGYNHPAVEEAAARQQRDGNCFNHPTEHTVLLAERLTALVDFASWAVLAKNGSDVTTWSIQVARQQTGRRKILRAKGSYHGADAWCTPGHGGIIEEDRTHIHEFIWNDAEDFDRQIKNLKDDLAAVIIGPFHYPAFGDSVLPEPGFLKTIQETCRRHGIVLILDDVRAGFRLDLGGSHRYFGFEPDMICFSKALGNGHPISAALGREELRVAASKVFLTGSFWNSAVPMAAALTVLDLLEKENTVTHLKEMGSRLFKGLEEQSKKHSLKIRLSGPPSLPFMSFADETNFLRSQLFAAECTRLGVLFHPHHNWFLSGAHQAADIDDAVAIADKAFASVRAQFGPSSS